MRDTLTFSTPTPEQIAEEPMPLHVFFAYDHLPPFLALASAPFAALAMHVVATRGQSAERTITLRKLLEAKDAAVRCAHLEAVAQRKAELAAVREVDGKPPEHA